MRTVWAMVGARPRQYSRGPARAVVRSRSVTARAWTGILLLMCAAPGLAQERPPNIIHIVADDVGYDDVGPFGSTDIPTPHLDRLAKEGRRLTSFYAPHSTCTPTRAALLTGAYAPRVGLPSVLFPDSRIGLNAEEVTIAELLKGRGYATAVIGKWHLGHLPAFLPTRHGFDRFFGIPYPNDHVPERLAQTGDRVSRGFPPMPLIRDDTVVEQPAQLASLPTRFTEAAVGFIEEHRDRPFFLHFSNIETHTPWLVPQPFQYKSKAGLFGDAVVTLDWSVGQILAAVEKAGLDQRTLIVFTSDNGPLVERYPELEGIYGHAATVDTSRRHRLRGGKYQSRYDGGTRVACLVRWPGRVPPGTSSDALVAGFDLYTTFAALAGAAIPTDRIVDGMDVWPILAGTPAARPPRDSLYYFQNYQLVAVREGKWKLVLPWPKSPGDPELYDLEADPGETRNVASAFRDVVQRLEVVAERARDDLGDALTNRTGRNRRPPGRAD